MVRLTDFPKGSADDFVQLINAATASRKGRAQRSRALAVVNADWPDYSHKAAASLPGLGSMKVRSSKNGENSLNIHLWFNAKRQSRAKYSEPDHLVKDEAVITTLLAETDAG